MKRRTCIVMLTVLWSVTLFAERKEVHILSANDMHAAIEAFPQLADIADSLRCLYPSLLIFSAGDNRTGEPLNDRYEIPAYPMVALMNQIGFDASALGNHEFDSRQQGLARLLSLSNFRHICANIQPDPSLGIHCVPYQVFDAEGLKVGVVGAVQLGERGIPDSHPDNVKGISFLPVKETIQKYSWLREECDVIILLTHIGYEDDVELSKEVPWVDLIIGGHTHTQLDGGEIHNGILITQNVNRLQKVTHTTLVVENGKVVEKKAENIDVRQWPHNNKVVAEMVRFFSENPAFYRQLTMAEAPFSNYEELGCMMCDAFRAETGADVAIQNTGGIRYETKEAGPFTVSDVLRLDPFGNDAVELLLTGEELRQLLMACGNSDGYGFPRVSGLRCDVFYDEGDKQHVKNLKLYTPEGKKFNLKKTYKVVTNSYVVTISNSSRKDQGRSLNRQTADLIIDYLSKQPSINYQGVRRTHRLSK